MIAAWLLLGCTAEPSVEVLTPQLCRNADWDVAVIGVVAGCDDDLEVQIDCVATGTDSAVFEATATAEVCAEVVPGCLGRTAVCAQQLGPDTEVGLVGQGATRVSELPECDALICA